jgi:hypothetical protein
MNRDGVTTHNTTNDSDTESTSCYAVLQLRRVFVVNLYEIESI